MNINMITNHLLIFTLLLTVACGKDSNGLNNYKITNGKMFFENTQRITIDAKNYRSKGIAQVNRCTGFFIKNDNFKNYIVSASHCTDYNPKLWCKTGFATDYYNGKKLSCLGVVVGDKNHDIVVYEFEASERDHSRDFILADFVLKKNMPLTMYGFPVDNLNPNIDLKISQNCWVRSPASSNIYGHFYPAKIKDKNFTHNCSTYGGNSGGPIALEGSNIVVGLPDAYSENITNLSPDKSSQGVLISGFVNDFRLKIVDLKIKLKKSTTWSTLDLYLDHFKANYFISKASTCQIRITKVNYNTGAVPTDISATLSGPRCRGEKVFKCDAIGKCTDKSFTSITILGPRSFVYDNKNGIELLYTVRK
jgi:hypothetical protein